jgi:hypothetical protein
MVFSEIRGSLVFGWVRLKRLVFPVRLRLVPLLAGVDPTPSGAKHPKSDDHHKTDGDDEVHARPLFIKDV